MKRSALLAILLTLGWALAWAPVRAEHRIALVIGNGGYSVRPLECPVRDAKAVAGALERLGFDVKLETDAGHSRMEETIREFGDRLRKAPGAVGLFYFSGHGAQHQGANYLIPVDTIGSIHREGHLREKAVSAGYALAEMEGTGSSVNLMVLDACRDNPFKGFTKSLSRGLGPMGATGGVLIAYATKPGDVALEGEGDTSLYTKHLLAAIESMDAPAENVLKEVAKRVHAETGGRQWPWTEGSILGDFYFRQRGAGQPERNARAVGPASLPALTRRQPGQPSTAPDTGDRSELGEFEFRQPGEEQPSTPVPADTRPRSYREPPPASPGLSICDVDSDLLGDAKRANETFQKARGIAETSWSHDESVIALYATPYGPKLYGLLLTKLGAQKNWTLEEARSKYRRLMSDNSGLEFYVKVVNRSAKPKIPIHVGDICERTFLEDEVGNRYGPVRFKAPSVTVLLDEDSYTVWFPEHDQSGQSVLQKAGDKFFLVITGQEMGPSVIRVPFTKRQLAESR